MTSPDGLVTLALDDAPADAREHLQAAVYAHVCREWPCATAGERECILTSLLLSARFVMDGQAGTEDHRAALETHSWRLAA